MHFIPCVVIEIVHFIYLVRYWRSCTAPGPLQTLRQTTWLALHRMSLLWRLWMKYLFGRDINWTVIFTVIKSFWKSGLQETLWPQSMFSLASQWAYRRFINLIIVVIVFHHGGRWRPLSVRLSVFHAFQFIVAVFLVLLFR